MAEIIALLDPPPLEFIQRSQVGSAFWDEQGMFLNVFYIFGHY